MNVHDSERLSGPAGGGRLRPACRTGRTAPTSSCSTPARCGRTRTTGCTATSGHLLPVKNAHPGMQIAVGGCLAQKDRGDDHRSGAPWVDVVFGTHNIGSLPVLLRAGPGRSDAGAGRDRSSRWRRSRRCCPSRRESAYSAWVVDLGRLQQHLHVLHRAQPARPGGGPAARRHPGRDRGAGRRRRAGGHPARAERELLRRRVRRPAGVRQAAARLRRDRRPGAGPVHLAAPAGLHRRRDRARWPRPRT